MWVDFAVVASISIALGMVSSGAFRMDIDQTVQGNTKLQPYFESKKCAKRQGALANESRHKVSLPEGVRRLWINIGPNSSPIEATGAENADVFVVLVDPLDDVVRDLRERYKDNRKVLVIQAAVADYRGIAVFRRMNQHGWSSSLARPMSTGPKFEEQGQTAVPVLSLKDLIDSLPLEDFGGTVEFLKTDMQGYDFVAIQSLGEEIRRVRHIKSEVWADGHPSYQGVRNFRNENWKPYLDKMGFDEVSCMDAYHDEVLSEMDCDFSNRVFSKLAPRQLSLLQKGSEAPDLSSSGDLRQLKRRIRSQLRHESTQKGTLVVSNVTLSKGSSE